MSEKMLRRAGAYDDVRALMELAKVDDWRIETGRGHPKLVWSKGDSELIATFACSPSDRNATKALLQSIRSRMVETGMLPKPSKAGRKRKIGAERFPGGKIQPPSKEERERDIVETVVQQRIKHKGATRENARHQEWGYPLGELLKQDRISPEQKRAGDEWIIAFTRYWRLKGYQPLNAKVASYAEMIAGINVRRDPDDEDVLKAQRIYMDIDNHIKHACMYEDLKQVYAALRKILVEQTEAKYIKEVEIGYLRLALNSLVRFFRIGG